MHVRKMSALALVAAGLSLTACGGNDSGSGAPASAGASATGSSTPSTTASTGAGGSGDATGGQGPGSSAPASSSAGSAGGSTTGSGVASGGNGSRASGGSMCATANLAFSVSSAMAQDELLVNLRNTGSSTCSMHGFPGVDLEGGPGTAMAARTDIRPATVTLAPGAETRFVLHWIPDTSGSGVTYTSLLVTPPNETHSKSVSLGKLTITIAAPSPESPDVYVDPVGYGK